MTVEIGNPFIFLEKQNGIPFLINVSVAAINFQEWNLKFPQVKSREHGKTLGNKSFKNTHFQFNCTNSRPFLYIVWTIMLVKIQED